MIFARQVSIVSWLFNLLISIWKKVYRVARLAFVLGFTWLTCIFFTLTVNEIFTLAFCIAALELAPFEVRLCYDLTILVWKKVLRSFWAIIVLRAIFLRNFYLFLVLVTHKFVYFISYIHTDDWLLLLILWHWDFYGLSWNRLHWIIGVIIILLLLRFFLRRWLE